MRISERGTEDRMGSGEAETARRWRCCAEWSSRLQMTTEDVVNFAGQVRHPQSYPGFDELCGNQFFSFLMEKILMFQWHFLGEDDLWKDYNENKESFWCAVLRKHIINTNIQNRRPWDADRIDFCWPWYVPKCQKSRHPTWQEVTEG